MRLHHDIDSSKLSKTCVFCHANLRLSLVNKIMPPDGKFMSKSIPEVNIEPDKNIC